jgi:hypothetical protein
MRVSRSVRVPGIISVTSKFRNFEKTQTIPRRDVSTIGIITLLYPLSISPSIMSTRKVLGHCPDYLLDEMPLYIFEEMIDDSYVRKNQTSEDGGASPARIPYIKRFHILKVKPQQVYICHRLDRTPHYSIHAFELEQFLEHLARQGVNPITSVTVYERDQSYVGTDLFLQVINGDTPEFELVADDFKTIDFRRIIDDCSELPASDRGNKQLNGGFSCQDFNHRDLDTSVAKPGKGKHTDMLTDVLLKLSRMGDTMKLFDKRQLNNHEEERLRSQTFSKMINVSNKLEGVTVGVADSDAKLLTCHLDHHNDPQDGHDTVIVASVVVLDVSTPGHPKYIRAVAIGYDRKSCQDYIHRVNESSPAVVDVRQYRDSLSSQYNFSLLENQVPMEHKKAFLSAFKNRYSLPRNRSDIVLRTIARNLSLSKQATENLIWHMLESSYGRADFLPGRLVYTFHDDPLGTDIPCRELLPLFDVSVSEISALLPEMNFLAWRTVTHINEIDSNGVVVSFSARKPPGTVPSSESSHGMKHGHVPSSCSVDNQRQAPPKKQKRAARVSDLSFSRFIEVESEEGEDASWVERRHYDRQLLSRECLEGKYWYRMNLQESVSRLLFGTSNHPTIRNRIEFSKVTVPTEPCQNNDFRKTTEAYYSVFRLPDDEYMECNLAAIGNGRYFNKESMNNFRGVHVDELKKERIVFLNKSTSKEALLLSVLLYHRPDGSEQLEYRREFLLRMLKITRRNRILPVQSSIFTKSGNPLMFLFVGPDGTLKACFIPPDDKKNLLAVIPFAGK